MTFFVFRYHRRSYHAWTLHCAHPTAQGICNFSILNFRVSAGRDRFRVSILAFSSRRTSERISYPFLATFIDPRWAPNRKRYRLLCRTVQSRKVSALGLSAIVFVQDKIDIPPTCILSRTVPQFVRRLDCSRDGEYPANRITTATVH